MKIANILRKLVVEQYISSIRNEQLRIRLKELEQPTLAAVCKVVENFFIDHKDDRCEGSKGWSRQFLRKEMAPKQAQLIDSSNKPVNAELDAIGCSSRNPLRKKTNRGARGCFICGKFGHKVIDCREPRRRKNLLA